MTIPESFQKRLHRVFDGRLRIRWSNRDRDYKIEQRVGNAVLPPIRIEEDRDDLICARDGYVAVVSVRTGDRMPCPTCEFTELKVPIRSFGHVRCPYCVSKGKDGRIIAGFWPLDDSLIDHLRATDPLRGATEELSAACDKANADLLLANERKFSNTIEAHTCDNFNALVGIPSFAYSGAKHWPTDGIIPKETASPECLQ